MEINIKNAFLIAIKITLEPFLPIYITAAKSVQNGFRKIINYTLRSPEFTTFTTLFVMIHLAAILMISLSIYFGILCFIVSVIILKGLFIFISILLILYGTIIIMLMIAIITY